MSCEQGAPATGQVISQTGEKFVASGGKKMASITSDELNFLVFRYLQESGFTHSAYVLGYEAFLHKSNINGNNVPPGALISFIQKGLQYLEMEANLTESNAEVDSDFALLQPIDLITKDVGELREIVRGKRDRLERERDKEAQKEKEKEAVREKEREREKLEREKERERTKREEEREREKVEREKERERERETREKEREEKRLKVDDTRRVDGKAATVPQPMEEDAKPDQYGTVIKPSEVTILEGHSSEVFICAWSPTSSTQLASGSGDSTARIWHISEGPCGDAATQAAASRPLVLKHFKGKTNEKSKDVTTLDWNGDGSLLATGSYDGQARVWSKDGELKQTLTQHRGPIFSLKWNKKGDYLLSGSVDKTAIIWDVKTGDVKQQFAYHTAPTLDVDWRNNQSFATCSTDKNIFVCKLGDSAPVKVFYGHQDEVNAIKWDPAGNLLASCSDDFTAKIWSLKNDKCLLDLRKHTKEIYTIKWSPTGPGSINPNLPLQLVSASFDSTIKVWEVEKGQNIHNLTLHTEPVYSVAFSPNGEYLASGSFDRCLHIWSLKDGTCIRTYKGSGGIFEVCWNKDGDKVGACFANNTLCVLDFRM